MEQSLSSADLEHEAQRPNLHLFIVVALAAAVWIIAYIVINPFDFTVQPACRIDEAKAKVVSGG